MVAALWLSFFLVTDDIPICYNQVSVILTITTRSKILMIWKNTTCN